ncbi:DoxX family protein [Amycolatopsis vancoresmycina]|uniref:DoxX family protein n=1 Tax=Amycolatopsis vancoresmycina DSM 44592 TaxID=1292037 RepID=R1FWA0_9PSEU|nr:DoxX family protein [Amycolatopsis vancoresmycina]EOD63683.1 DoxX family protein [Amycolatopsis vancoresmycina DSM 44592]
MNVVLWIAAGLLAVLYLFAGGMKLATPREKLLENPNMGWAADFSEAAVKGIGAVEVLGALGLILPWALGIAPVLTPLAATGLAVVQVGAIVVHVRRKEAKALPMNVVLLLLAAFVAVGRFAG